MLELRKMRRLHTLPVVLVLVVAVSALSSISLFSEAARSAFDDPAANPWAALLLTYTLMSAMGSPVLVAVLASRQTDIEHSSSGWILAATAGYLPGMVCRAKLVVLGLVITPAAIAQSLLVVAAGYVAGIRVPLDLGPWIGYTVLLVLVDIALCALHIWLATVVENQLISVGVGMLGAFVAVFTLFLSPVGARFIPWGYYAVISFATQSGDQASYTQPPYLWVGGFLVLIGAVFAVVTRRLDRLEGQQ